ncbi:maltose O-acetyltransferase [Propionispira arboris]|uniref:Maltose O-acetyltransferase n=1 Tax=Propionispira arboris TaxID=84035 RepID=A0A1H6X8H4_9FIRM|nr:sugar O-acetyltransferase [Propionispira arboris]SEJ20845.1 maltose O-acetyltransferase [Propionispira arboris]
MSELDKCMSGNMFNCIDEELTDMISKSRIMTHQYNSSSSIKEKQHILHELFGEIGSNVKVDVPFYCDYGKNIFIGNNGIINMNCTFVDCNKIEIGNNVLIASNVQIYTATHPVNAKERLVDGWKENSGQAFFRTYALPVKIEDNVWIGGGTIILPGVTIGKNSVIGAGSIVTKNIPANCVAVGNPCRVIKKLSDKKE